jgi:glycerophosphoryl diester phosphodiesterase
MIPVDHDYLENTIPSMAAAFDYGADIVEFDVHQTVDDRFTVFHDWTVDCRTNGTGVTREQTLDTLQALDIGYGYTADGGQTWPFRGQGVGLMPSLDEVLTTFPDRNFLIDVKSNDAAEGELLAERLAALMADRTGEIMVYGGERPINVIGERLPHLKTIDRPRLRRCLIQYFAIGWTGYVPTSCERGLLMTPANMAPWLWGWPNRFLQRMDRVGSQVMLVGDYYGEGFSQGFDDPARLNHLPTDYSGGIWTDRIDLIGPAVARQK